MAHLGDQLSAYVDGRLSPAVLYAWDRHVLVCPGCRQRVDEERGLLASLRAAPAPGMSASLQAMLLSLGDGAAGGVAPRVPAQASAPPLPVLHRSLRRSMVLAAMAAGASATAAWTLAVVQAPATASTIGTPPAPTAVAPTARPVEGLTGAVIARLGPAPTPRVLPARSGVASSASAT